ncbi:hypothetical protein QIS74_13617 [Colletotrichum tabaci]|uniref:Uncharacterized protein n=1 Tax=Colletotrichum tabaci TaxID=1209068 RepID=A0AAV9SSK3_9PEZI
MFNGGIVTLTADGIVMLRQKGQGKKIELVDAKSPDATQAYHQQQPTEADLKTLNRRLQWQMESIGRGFDYVALDLATVKLFIFSDGSFANNGDLSSQLGFIISLANEKVNDDDGVFDIRGNIVHFSSPEAVPDQAGLY